MARVALAIIALLATPLVLDAAESQANPIRKVVTMLEAMVGKVTSEGEKETELYDKFMCYCKNAGGDLSNGIANAETKMPQLESDIKESEAKLSQLKEDIQQHQADRSAAKTAMEEATSLRGKEASAFSAMKAEADSNIAAMQKAVTALEKGMGGGFLQTSAAQVLQKVVNANQEMTDSDRQEVQSFLSQGEEYNPSSGQVTGILKTMGDEMSKGLAEATSTEDASIKSFNELIAAKKKEVGALTRMIEEKLTRVGDLGVAIATMKNDLGDTAAGLMEDKKFLEDMDKNCAAKTEEHNENVKMRGQELVALADTIKVLNDDDAMELFKKTLPSSSASLLQVKITADNTRARALAILQEAPRSNKLGQQLDFIALALRGQKIGFEKVIKMVEEMVVTLKREQQEDNDKKEYCAAQLDATDDKKKGLERSISDLETAIASAQEGISTLAEEIKSLEDSIKALDKSVAEATEQRKSENEDFKDLMASDSAAKELLDFAKNRLNKFYNPKLYVAPAKRELSESERLTINNGGTLAPTAAPGGIAGTGVAVLSQVRAHGSQDDAPPPPPATAAAYKKSGEESGGVIAMIDLLIKDLDKEMTVAKSVEKDSQADYEGLMSDSAAKRAEDSKALGDKESAKADMAADLQARTDDKAAAGRELQATMQYLSSLHLECDWLMKYFDVRREARDGEIDALGKAKAVLSGADFALLQTQAGRHLRG